MIVRGLVVVCIAILAVSPVRGQQRDEEGRLSAIEERLTRLEQKLERLLKLIPDSAAQEEIRLVSGEVQTIAAELQESEESELSSYSADGSQVTAEVLTSPQTDVADEITHVPYSGYMEFHANNDGLNPTTLDFHRFVLLFGHGFGDRIRFWSELELEHGFIEGGETSGELELEQAYLDFLIHPKFNFRTGLVLTPVGIINERHEPPSFNGVERPFVDTVILPTTWWGSGAGLVGDLGKGFAYRTYVMSSLDASEFSAEEGFRGGRQKGFLENARNLAWTGRLEFRGIPGLNTGVSFWTGEAGFNLPDISGKTSIFEFDGRYRWKRWEGRGQFVTTHLDEAAIINRALRQQRGINPNIAEKMRGFYLEGGASLVPTRFKQDLVGFYRYENFDTQYRMPSGFLPIRQFDRSAHILGLTYYPYPDVALKLDYNIMKNASQVVEAFNRWNFGVGWWF